MLAVPVLSQLVCSLNCLLSNFFVFGHLHVFMIALLFLCNIFPFPSVVPPAYYAHLAAFRARDYMEEGSDRGSTIPGGMRNDEVKPLPRIKDNIKDLMFYC